MTTPVAVTTRSSPAEKLGGSMAGQESSFPAPHAQFRGRCRRLGGLQPSCPELRTELNLLLDQLISENYSGAEIRPEEICTLLTQASRLVPPSQEHLVVKLCQLIHQLLNQLQVIVDEPTLDTLVSYTCQALYSCSPWTHPEVLLAMSALVYANGPQCKRHLPELLGPSGLLMRYSAPSQPDMELRQAAVHCMSSLCMGLPGKPCLEQPYRGVCFKTFLQTLQCPRPPEGDDIVYCMLLQSALKGLQYYLNGENCSVHQMNLADSFLLCNTSTSHAEVPPVLYPAPLSQYDSVTVVKSSTAAPQDTPEAGRVSAVGSKKRKSHGRDRKSGVEGRRSEAEDVQEEREVVPTRGQASDRWSPRVQLVSGATPSPSWKKGSSDSEVSDPEGGMQGKIRLYQARVRLSSLHCFLSLLKCVEKRVLFGYWSSFLPDAPTPGSASTLTLLTIVLKDPSPKVRAGSLQVLSALLDGSRGFLSTAEDVSVPRQAFTPLSATLAASLRELHRSLSLALLAESSPHTLTQVIKCLAHLVCNVPYQRLRPGLLSPLWKQIRPYIRHRDVNVRVSCLTLLGALVSAQAPLTEVAQLLKSGDGGGASEEGPCWLLQLCMCLVTKPRDGAHSDSDSATSPAHRNGPAAMEPLPVRLEAMQVLALMVKGYFSLVHNSLLELGHLCNRCLGEEDAYIQLHGSKLLQELGSAITQLYRAEGDSCLPLPQVPVALHCLNFWSNVLNGPLTAALQDELHPTLQTSACDALASILPQAFSQLPSQVMCMTMLLGLTYGGNSAAAVRALGVYVLFPCLQEDVMFVVDAANAILACLTDCSSNVRTMAAWSLGNLADTLIVNMSEVSDLLLLKMLTAATQASRDKDRVKSNAVRALGNLLYFLGPEQIVRPQFSSPIEEAMHALTSTVCSDVTMKVRWNACYGLGNAFRNPSLNLGSASWSADAFSALTGAVASCRNFKVRINAAAALSVPPLRQNYGDAAQFARVWQALVEALEGSVDSADFLEYRYSSSLRTQLCQALLHLLSLCQPEDLAGLTPSLSGHVGSSLVQHLTEDGSPAAEGKDGAVLQGRVQVASEALVRLREFSGQTHADTLVDFLEDVLRSLPGDRSAPF
uniref:HEAT repeat-containing protein 6 n=1 Tax=Denticeps clupeoides TaxID=299321 RepID=A0AAY4BUG8_9TELE